MNSTLIIKAMGAGLATFLWVHYLGMPYGILAGIATVLLFLS
jgi:hypothetical protein